MLRTIWDWLEIDETRDRDLIRKAYARQAKKYHPEDMPEEAEQLRKAYQKALSLAAEDVGAGFCRADEEKRETLASPPENGEIRYRYRLGAVCHEMGKKNQSGSQYHYGMREEKKVPPARFDYYQFDAGRMERVKQLEERLDSLYHSAGRSDLSLWADAVTGCLTGEDLKDTHVVAAALSALTQMRGMNGNIW